MEIALHLVPDTSSPLPGDGYLVLARKYRPTTLDQVIGQDFLVELLKRGLENNRLGHAFILTGIRGTGKTTLARLMARAFNCETGPTPTPCGTCTSCVAIREDRSLDVIEIDAASRTSVDDIREIIEASRYKAASAKHKIYIIDEVHMLSKSAFNALLKTLEEPPPHVKFIFATTEIHKVPATILSRCVRFDLKRIEMPTLVAYFKTICEKENLTFEEDGLILIARAAEGSVRDGLSLLDQAMSCAEGHIKAEHVRQMLGFSNQGALLDLFHRVAEGNCEAALEQVRALHQGGADPLRLIEELLELTHELHCFKINQDLAALVTWTEDKRQKLTGWGEKLSLPTLTRLWQMLLKGFEELKRAPSPQRALEVLIIRLTHLAPLPSLIDLLEEEVKKKL